jgi:hypothetical protein
MMKKRYFLLFFHALAIFFLAIAFTEPLIAEANNDDSTIISPEAAAQALSGLGLFKGTARGFELERGMNRAEAAVMLVRLLGAEEEAVKKNIASPFSDVPEWAALYVGWLYENDLTNGTGNGCYSPFSPITYEHYVLFLVRTISSVEVLANERVLVNDTGSYLLPNEIFGMNNITVKTHLITRGEAAVLSAHALSLANINGKSNALKLLEKGIISREQLLEHAGALFGEQYVKDKLLYEYPLYYMGEETPFLASAANLYRRDEGNMIELHKSDNEQLCAYEILYMDEQKIIFHFAVERACIFCYDTLQQKLVDTGLSLDHYLRMGIVYGKQFYVANDTDIYNLNLTNNTWKHIYSPGKAINSPDGFCTAPGGIVAILQDGSFLYFNDDTATVIFPRLKHEYWTYDTAILSYDGTKLTMRNKVMAEKAGGEMVYYCYTVLAESDKATCTGFEKIFYYAEEESIMEVEEELRREYIADFQKWLDELYGLE